MVRNTKEKGLVELRDCLFSSGIQMKDQVALQILVIKSQDPTSQSICITLLGLITSYKWDSFLDQFVVHFLKLVNIVLFLQSHLLLCSVCFDNEKEIESCYKCIIASRLNSCKFKSSMNLWVLTA